METLKSWKQKTKLVALAVTVAFAGVGGSATPAEAQTGSRMCIADKADDDGDILFFERRVIATNKCGSSDDMDYSPGPWKWVDDRDGYIKLNTIGDGKWEVETAICENFTRYYLKYTGDVCAELKALGLTSGTYGSFNTVDGTYTFTTTKKKFNIGEAPS